jgi:phospholipase/carboxylesterase
MKEGSMAVLDGPRWGPQAGGAPRQLVVLCHGLGADGNDLIDLAPSWAVAAPHALFISPHAPMPFEGAPHGRQWFPLTDRSPAAIEAGARQARVALDAFLDTTLAELGLPPDAYVLMGFSQGAMISLYTGLRRPVPPRVILAYSGVLAGAESLPKEIVGRPPVLLVHGEADQVVPVAATRAAEQVLRGLGVEVQALYCPDLPHGIDQAGLSAGSLALQRACAAD